MIKAVTPARAGFSRGFTLIEMAIVLVIVVLLLGSLLVPLESQTEQRRTSETETKLNEIKDALVGYAVANGRIPCPASSTSNGQESFCTTVSGSCTVTLAPPPPPPLAEEWHWRCSNFFDGFVPAVTLGLTQVDSQGYAVDAWGLTQNRIRYAVMDRSFTSATGTQYTFTTPNGMKAEGMTVFSSAPLIHVCASGVGATGTNCNTAVTLTSNAPAVVYSVGKNAAAATAGTGQDEIQNPNPNDVTSANRVFVSHTKSNGSAAGGEFDDIVTWLSTNILFNRMVAAGKLP